MNKIFAFTLVLALTGCSYFSGSSSKTKSAELIDQAKQNCTQLGYEPNTKAYLDCTTGQYNKMQERYYGPLQ